MGLRYTNIPDKIILLSLLSCLLVACVRVPEGLEPVTGFEQERYLGTWYEIARLDHSFERGLSNVTASYSLREDGGIRVLNRGFDADRGEWDEAEGRAYFVESETSGFLKVSFFGPFYGAYVVFDLDDDYQWSYVSGPDRSYLWLLSRSPQISDEARQRFTSKAEALGFDLGELVWVEQDDIPEGR